LKTSSRHGPRTSTEWFEFLADQSLLSDVFRRLENGRFRHGLLSVACRQLGIASSTGQLIVSISSIQSSADRRACSSPNN
jgi:hypothetical protein